MITKIVCITLKLLGATPEKVEQALFCHFSLIFASQLQAFIDFNTSQDVILQIQLQIVLIHFKVE